MIRSVVAASAMLTVAATDAAADSPYFQNGFGQLADQLGDKMGEPLEMEHPGNFLDSIVQMTSMGIAYYQPGHAPSFYDGVTRYALRDKRVITWQGDTLDPPVEIVAPTGVWDLIKGCETPGRGWDANTGNGFYGGLQFDFGTWLANGGAKYGRYAYQATRSEQIEIAENLRAVRGYAPWPACRIRLKLP